MRRRIKKPQHNAHVVVYYEYRTKQCCMFYQAEMDLFDKLPLSVRDAVNYHMYSVIDAYNLCKVDRMPEEVLLAAIKQGHGREECFAIGLI